MAATTQTLSYIFLVVKLIAARTVAGGAISVILSVREAGPLILLT